MSVREMQFSVKHPELESTLQDQKHGRRRYDIQKNSESKLFPNFATSWEASEQDDLKSRSSLYSTLNRATIHGPMSHILSHSHNNSTIPKMNTIGKEIIQSSSKSPIESKDLIKSKDQRPPSTKSKVSSGLLPISPSKIRSDLGVIIDEKDEEIENLKNKLKAKEHEVQKIMNELKRSRSTFPEEEVFNNMSKLEYDKKLIETKRKMASNSLDLQISEKNEMKKKAAEFKQREISKRLDMLRILREQDDLDRINRIQRAKEYKEQLDVQQYFKNSVNVPKKSPSPENFSRLYAYNPPNPFKVGSSSTLSPLPSEFLRKSQQSILPRKDV